MATRGKNKFKKLTLNVLLGDVDFLDARNYEGSSLASAVLGTCKDIAPCKNDGDRFFLDRAWLFKALLEDTHEELALQIVVLKLVALGRSHIL